MSKASFYLSFQLISPKPNNLHLDVRLFVTYRLLNKLQLLNFLEFLFLSPFPLLHTVSTSYLLLISECTHLHSLRAKGCHVMLYILYLGLLHKYCLPSFAGQLLKIDEARIDSLCWKAFRGGFCCQTFSIGALIPAGDKKFFRQISNESHCLHPLLPKQRNNKVLNSLRNRDNNYLLPQTESALFNNSFFKRSLVLIFSVLCVYSLC